MPYHYIKLGNEEHSLKVNATTNVKKKGMVDKSIPCKKNSQKPPRSKHCVSNVRSATICGIKKAYASEN